MPNEKPSSKLNAKLLWMQFEDVLAPRLGLTVWDRAVYSYLLRHSLLIGKTRLNFSVSAVADRLRLSRGPVRQAVRRLDELGALRLVERSKFGHVVEMRRPDQISALQPGDAIVTDLHDLHGPSPDAASPSTLESTDFMSTWALRKTLHDRERGVCFYCLRRTSPTVRCLDHVVPRVRSGRNSYRNLVSCCLECNTLKADMSAPDYLRILYRKGRLTPKEHDIRLQALKLLAAGNLRPGVNTSPCSLGLQA